MATLLPQRSSAAASLDHLVAAQSRSTVMFRLTSYTIDANGRTPKIWSGYVKGKRWRYVQSNFEQAFDGVRTMTYVPGEAYATTTVGDGDGSGSVLGTADLSSWRLANRKNLTLDRETLWRGRKVDKYTMEFRFPDGAEATLILYADPQRDLPLCQETLYSPTSGYSLEWEYLDPAREDLLRIKLPTGSRIREVAVNSVPLGSPEKADAKGKP